MRKSVKMSGPIYQILLIEDAESDVLLIREALEQAGLEFELHVLGDGEKALEFIAKIDNDETAPRPRLIILDLNLPKVSGGHVLARVRQGSRLSPVPVLVLTSSDSPKDKAEIAQFAATRYFRKSSKLNEFMSLGLIVRSLLERGDFGSRASAR
jgi:two-component system, chemotaxis family, response regulator Rcp1